MRVVFPILLLLTGCGLSDLRPDALQERTASAEEARGRAVLERARLASQGKAKQPWGKLSGVEVELTDEFYGFVGFFARKWPNNPQEMVFRFHPKGDKGTVTFRGVDQPLVWGIHEWNSWTREGEQGKPVYEQNEDITFWLPTMEYFLEMAFRLGEATIVDYAGTVDLNGKPHERVYLTWGTYAPNAKADQYLAFVRKKDGFLTRCDFTVRDLLGFIVGAVHYSDFQAVAGYVLPHKIVIGDTADDPLHILTIKAWRPGVDVPRKEYAPDPKRAPRKKPGS